MGNPAEAATQQKAAEEPKQPLSQHVPQNTPDSVWDRIKRHKVVEWSLAYIAFGYAALHGSQMLRETFEWSLVVPRVTFFALLLGLPFAVTLAWYHGHRAQHRVSRAEISILATLLVIAGSVLWIVSRSPHTREAASSQLAYPSTADPLEPPDTVGKSIAVLPFVDMSESHDQEYFGDGIAEEILNQLAKLPGVRVTGRTSSFQFKNRAGDIRGIGKSLGVAYVLEGSVRRSGSHLRVSGQLLETQSGTHRWSDVFDRELTDVLRIQDEIAMGLARALQIELIGSIPSRGAPVNLDAYESFLRGLHAGDQFNRAGMEEAIAHFRQALDLDPQLVSADEQLAITQWDMAGWGFVLPGPAYQAAKAAAQRALGIEPKSPIAHAVLCDLYTRYDWDWVAAARECDVAIKAAPHLPYILNTAATLQIALGKWESAIDLIEQARAADPFDPRVIETSGEIYIRAGRTADAEDAYRRVIAISPTYVWAHCALAIALVNNGRIKQALAEAEKETEPMERALGIAIVNHAMHRTTLAENALRELEGQARELWPMSVAEANAFLGHKDQALEWLERAYKEKDSTLYWIKGDPLLRTLEQDPRYKAFLRKLNLPE